MSPYTALGSEPELEEVINDPIVRLLVDKDREHETLMQLLQNAGRNGKHLALCAKQGS